MQSRYRVKLQMGVAPAIMTDLVCSTQIYQMKINKERYIC